VTEVIDLSKITESGLRLGGSLARVQLAGDEALVSLGWNLFILPSGPSDQDFFFDVQASATYECTCCRCLEPADVQLAVRSQFLGSRDKDLVARGSHTLGTQDLDVVYMPEEALDEEAFLREQLALQLPMQALCKEGCLGLCSTCGKNWNKGPCACRPEYARTQGVLARAFAEASLARTGGLGLLGAGQGTMKEP
jgi:uncharacterized protein